MEYTDEMRSADFHWFLGMYDKLFKKYGHKFFTIRDKTILGVYNDEKAALRETQGKYELGTFIVQECDGTPNAYTDYLSTPFFLMGDPKKYKYTVTGSTVENKKIETDR